MPGTCKDFTLCILVLVLDNFPSVISSLPDSEMSEDWLTRTKALRHASLLNSEHNAYLGIRPVGIPALSQGRIVRLLELFIFEWYSTCVLSLQPPVSG